MERPPHTHFHYISYAETWLGTKYVLYYGQNCGEGKILSLPYTKAHHGKPCFWWLSFFLDVRSSVSFTVVHSSFRGVFPLPFFHRRQLILTVKTVSFSIHHAKSFSHQKSFVKSAIKIKNPDLPSRQAQLYRLSYWIHKMYNI
jgi:hypothetical protein